MDDALNYIFFLDEYTKPNAAVLREAMKQCLQQMTEIYSIQIDFVRVYVCMFKRQQLFSSSFERTVNNNFHLNKTTSIISKTCYRTSISFPSFPHLYQKTHIFNPTVVYFSCSLWFVNEQI